MLYYLASALQQHFGPFRLLQSFAVLISLALYAGFFLTVFLLPKTYKYLPKDRGREFTPNAEAAIGKPTGAGIIFISLFIVISILLIPLNASQIAVMVFTFLAMLTGFLDDRSVKSWSEYLKGGLDLLLSVGMSVALLYLNFNGKVFFWLPFITNAVAVHPVVFVIVSTVIIWISINTTNCTDGVDGLSGTLVLIALLSLGIIFYFVLGHTDIAAYLLVPHLADGATWAVIVFALSGVLMGYLWHNAFPSKVLMGDAGSRALGFFIGVGVMISGNPFLILMTSSVMLINGGTGLLKVALLRFFNIKILHSIRFPLHDHMRKNLQWSPTQILLKFMIMQVLITLAVVGIFFKVR
ncbi:phospho-N-acetylmuramoyl-pentapeptide-transferase [Brucepastera parasyntrophica]|uniref:phospho-N-acetylmuramoyl-pentapeptide- transferase n=1 Tax=Brucepastera parasyntrophica TaxID=2880008 RepID=UPI00210CFEE7|nr:phospho-N-acetylmuramoyl-pentapeptide-transferase [Brucepastera parasyntrophica]ULQ60834.1 phospho-N-acetylmuramoyl-pentapeptide-transferase [Brucepastera parasyntrophica]